MPETAHDAQTPVRWGRVTGLLLLGLLVVEAASQVYVYAWAGERFRSFHKQTWSPYGLVRNNPDLTLPGFHHNRNGFRNLKDFTQAKPANTLRVMMLGGSTLYSGIASTHVAGAERVDSDATAAQFLEQELRADPALAGVNVEVINAAVNFNRIVEVSGGYLAEYAHWQPDVVIVFGSANNFNVSMPEKGEVNRRGYGVQPDHAWKSEFDRAANRKTFLAMSEHAVLYLEDNLASVALSKKGLTSAIDDAFAFTQARSFAKKPDAPRTYADGQECDLYVNEYLGYADALVAAAKRNNQDVAFFWEYFLRHLGGIRPFSEREQAVYDKIRREQNREEIDFNFYARDRLAEFCGERGVTFLNPLDVLKTNRETVFIDYLHYTKEGNRVMARFIYEQMRDTFRRRAQMVRDAGRKSAPAASE
ncbi:MAG TPA: hypothetical protein VGP08_19240 [Pyrinomonadaceae bacterium]|nr:hypothetical protein [Pyrinomonadaceae bacterium]